MRQVVRLNQRLLRQREEDEKKDAALQNEVNSFLNGMEAGEGSTKRRLTPREAAEVLAVEQGLDRNPARMERAHWLLQVSDTDNFHSLLPTDDTFFALSALRGVESSEFTARAHEQGLDAEDLKARGLVDFLSSEEEAALKKYIQDGVETDTTVALAKRGFVRHMKGEDKAFLAKFQGRLGLQDLSSGDQERLARFSSRLDVPTEVEREWLHAAQRTASAEELRRLEEKHGISPRRAAELRSRMDPTGQVDFAIRVELRTLVDSRAKLYREHEGLTAKRGAPTSLPISEKDMALLDRSFRGEEPRNPARLVGLLKFRDAHPTKFAAGVLATLSLRDSSRWLGHRAKPEEQDSRGLFLEALAPHVTSRALWERLPKDDTFFALSALRGIESSELRVRAQEQGLDAEDLKTHGLVDFLSPEEEAALRHFEADGIETEATVALARRGFIRKVRGEDYEFLAALQGKQNLDAPSDEEQKRAKALAFRIDLVTEGEKKWLLDASTGSGGRAEERLREGLQISSKRAQELRERLRSDGSIDFGVRVNLATQVDTKAKIYREHEALSEARKAPQTLRMAASDLSLLQRHFEKKASFNAPRLLGLLKFREDQRESFEERLLACLPSRDAKEWCTTRDEPGKENSRGKFLHWLAPGVTTERIRERLFRQDVAFFLAAASSATTENELRGLQVAYGISEDERRTLEEEGALRKKDPKEEALLESLRATPVLDPDLEPLAERFGIEKQALHALEKRGALVSLHDDEASFLERETHAGPCPEREGLLERWKEAGHSEKRFLRLERSGALSVLTKDEQAFLKALTAQEEPPQTQLSFQRQQEILSRVGNHEGRLVAHLGVRFHREVSVVSQGFSFYGESRETIAWREARGEAPPPLFLPRADDLRTLAKAHADKPASGLRALELRLRGEDKVLLASVPFPLWESAVRLDAQENLSPSKREMAEFLKASDFGSQKYLESLTKEEYFFLESLRKTPAQASALASRAQEFGLEGSAIARLRSRGAIDVLSEAEEELLKAIAERKESLHDTEEARAALRKRGFLVEPTEDDKRLLAKVEELAATLPSPPTREKIQALTKHLGVPEWQTGRLLKLGFLDCVSEKEAQALHELTQEPEPQKREEILARYEVWGKRRKALEERLQNPAGTDFSPHISSTPVVVRNVRVLLNESLSTLPEREKGPLRYAVEPKARDLALLLGGEFGEVPSFRSDRVRLAELRAGGVSLGALPIPSAKEIAWMEKLHGGKRAQASAVKSAADFGIAPERAQKLIDLQFLEYRAGRWFRTYNEPKVVRKAREWVATREHNPSEWRVLTEKKGLKEPPQALLALIPERKGFSPAPEVGDYELYFKEKRGEALTQREQRRKEFLAENGLPLSSRAFAKFATREDTLGSRLRHAQRQALLKDYRLQKGVNEEALLWLNIFKQMTAGQLEALGLSAQDLARYENDKIIQSDWSDELGEKYYFIQHSGLISGRAFLEESIPSQEVKVRPQQRQDLLKHDLLVVSGVMKVKAEMEAKGWKLKEVKNESMQFREAKDGKQNHERGGGPSFIDAMLVFETESDVVEGASGPTQRGGKGTLTVGVEYGDYRVETMSKKLMSTQYDEVHVFSSPNFQKRYQQKIKVVGKTRRFRTL